MSRQSTIAAATLTQNYRLALEYLVQFAPEQLSVLLLPAGEQQSSVDNRCIFRIATTAHLNGADSMADDMVDSDHTAADSDAVQDLAVVAAEDSVAVVAEVFVAVSLYFDPTLIIFFC